MKHATPILLVVVAALLIHRLWRENQVDANATNTLNEADATEKAKAESQARIDAIVKPLEEADRKLKAERETFDRERAERNARLDEIDRQSMAEIEIENSMRGQSQTAIELAKLRWQLAHPSTQPARE